MKPDPISLTLDDRRLMGLWAADSAERVLALVEAWAPNDTRPREAINGIRIFGKGGKRTVQLRSVALGALTAAREAAEVGAASASAAARSAGFAATTAYTKALASVDHAKHALGPAVYAALARELAAGEPSVGDEEIRWAIEHASLAIRKIVARWPARERGRTRLSELFHALDAGLRTEHR